MDKSVEKYFKQYYQGTYYLSAFVTIEYKNGKFYLGFSEEGMSGETEISYILTKLLIKEIEEEKRIN